MDEVYIPSFWLEASSEKLESLLERHTYDSRYMYEPYDKQQCDYRIAWLKQQIPIAKTRELIGG